ncbi:hypothetical protein [Methylobacterium gossipiicola]|uniref:Amino acid transporter protein n=1 Tax=Methylobacterium gossipiicola TaxID=582675 RepID=A0A1I2TJ08_9HYPH|nr:hypothetical protein [Methylobacterium gossipiicola]SFG64830.1 hypothetical protein SAMN05192565_107140 [Methylobacterium gossipiicola]
MASDELDQRNKLVTNERAKLTATYVNGVAVAVLAVGGLAPVFAQRLPGPIDPSAAIRTALTSLVCIVVSGVLHWMGRSILRGLR